MPVSEADRQDVRRRLAYDCPFWATHCATVLNEFRQPVKLVPRPWQARTPETPAHITPLDEAMEIQRDRGQPVRIIILKARKLGFSTWVQARFLQRVSQFPYQYALTVAHLRQSAGVLADMARLMYDRLPTENELGLGFNIKPQIVGQGTSRSGSRWLALGDRKKPVEASVYETMTAGAKGGGRASTPSLLHGSEVAHWEDPEFIVGLLNAVPKITDTEVVLESTANGFNDFQTRWERAVAGAEDPDVGGLYWPLFYGWQDNPRNMVAFPSEESRARFERTLGDPDGGGDEDELLLAENGVTLEQLRWRRMTRDEECGGKVEVFHQEHPSTPEEAFIGSGRPVFSGVWIARAIKAAEKAPAPVEGVLRGMDLKERRTRHASFLVPQRALWVPRSEIRAADRELWDIDRLLVWEHPVNAQTQEGIPAHEVRPDGQYVAFVDIAQGKNEDTAGRDYSVIQVWDHVNKVQVARFRSRIPLHSIAHVSFLVGLYYNTAILAPEATGLGVGVVDELAQDLRYPNLYRRRRAGDDRFEGAQGSRLGWSTDLRSKPLMEMTMEEAFKEGTHGIRDVPTARQFTTYVSDPKTGKHEAQKGSHDDLVMACMGAVRVVNELRPRSKSNRPKRPPRGYDPVTGYFD